MTTRELSSIAMFSPQQCPSGSLASVSPPVDRTLIPAAVLRRTACLSWPRRLWTTAVMCLISLAACKGKGGIQVDKGQISFIEVGDAGGQVAQLDAGEVTMDFGAVPVGTQATIAFKIEDTGNTAVVLGPVGDGGTQDGGIFQLFVPEGQIPRGGVLGSATFTPAAPGLQHQQLMLASNLGSGLQIVVTLMGSGLPPGLAVAPDPLDFGAVPVRTQNLMQAVVVNLTSLPVSLYLLPLTAEDAGALPLSDAGSDGLADGGAASDTGGFSIDPPGDSLGATPLAADGGSLSLSVHFDPVRVGPAAASVGLAVCPDCPALAILHLRGLALASALAVTPRLDFGFVHLTPAGQSRTLPVRIQNLTSRLTVNVVNPSVDPGPTQPSFFLSGAKDADSGVAVDFSLGTSPLLPGDAIEVPITFEPIESLAYQGALTVNSDDPDRPQAVVPLHGIGGGPVLSCSPASLNFGQVVVVPGNPGHRQLVTCSNQGTSVPGHPEASLFLTGLLLVPDAGAFNVSGPAEVPDSGWLPGQSFELEVGYAPSAVGSDVATLLVSDNDHFAAPQTVDLSGSAVPPAACDVSEVPAIQGLNFGQLTLGVPEILAVSLTNFSGVPCVIAGLGIAAGSAPAFTLVGDPPTVTQLSYPGDLNPNGDPLSLRVEVSANLTVTGIFGGEVSYQVLTGSPSARTVPLLAQNQPSCLSFSTSLIDFGLARQTAVNFTVSNLCSYPVTVSSLGTWLSDEPVAQFFLDSPDNFQRSFDPGAQQTLAAEFDPTVAGTHFGGVVLATDEGLNQPYFVGLRGSAVGASKKACDPAATLLTPDLLCQPGSVCAGGSCSGLCFYLSGVNVSDIPGCFPSQACAQGPGRLMGHCAPAMGLP